MEIVKEKNDYHHAFNNSNVSDGFAYNYGQGEFDS